ncbi:hypothetical protein PybrP1_003477 [[Pythium] brassicae (nom. inval.)]|nr:hypothetical protein PybrP1_003477 [[Pythium] brassicae (nom. inval.)]
MGDVTAFNSDAALAAIAAMPGERLMDLTFLQTVSLDAAVGGRKRALELSLLDDDYLDFEFAHLVDDDGTSGEGSDARDSPPPQAEVTAKQQPAKRQRKPSHVARKEAKMNLLAEIRHLEAHAALLRQETGVGDPRELKQRFALNADLREAILQQDLVVAHSQSAFTSFLKIRDANRFLVERTRHVNPFKASSELSQFETEEGDLCAVKVDVTPFEGVRSVQQVFDAMQFYLMNLEISHSELSGNVTIRENDPDTERAVLHHRLVIAERAGVVVEKNAVIFVAQSDFEAERPEEQWAIATGDFVGQDDPYPYCSSQRLRKDSTSVFKLTAHRRPGRSEAACAGASGGGADDGELVVVLTRWHMLRMRRPEFELPSGLFQEVAIDQITSADVMLRSMRQGIFSPVGLVNLA